MRTLATMLVLLGTSLCSAQQDYSKLSTSALRQRLATCAAKDAQPSCNEDVIEEAAKRYNSGASFWLKPLVHLSSQTDGALSESLGVFLSKLMIKRGGADRVLAALQGESENTQRATCMLAATADGSGIPPQDWIVMAAQVQQAARKDTNLRKIAKICTDELNMHVPANEHSNEPGESR